MDKSFDGSGLCVGQVSLRLTSMLGTLCVLVTCCLAVEASPVRAQEAARSEREVMFRRYLEFPSLIIGGSVEPQWLADGSSFWYTDRTSGHVVFLRVDSPAGTVTPLFDEDRLRDALAEALGHMPRGQGVPFDEFRFAPDDESRVLFTVEGSEFVLDLDTYALSRASTRTVGKPAGAVSRSGEVENPRGDLFARVEDHDLWLRSGSEVEGVQVTHDGTVDNEWIVVPHAWVRGFWTGTGARWSPDGRMLGLKKIDGSRVEELPFIRFLEPGAPLGWMRFPRAGDPTFQTELFVLHADSRELVRLDGGNEPDQRLEFLGWRDQKEVLFVRLNRRHTRLELLAANPRTGSSRVLITETSDTYLFGAGHGFERDLLAILPDGERFVWRSERDGYAHYYLYDFDGRLIRRLTWGEFPVLEVIGFSDDWFYFTARSEESPYDKHLYRVRLDGSELTRLTDAPGSHEIALSPSTEFFLDRHSSLDRPQSVDLRRADGSLVRKLAEADIKALDETWWVPPEEFVVKALDGRTDLYGVLFKPYDFDPSRKYPVVEYIYDGEQMSLRAFVEPFTAQRVLRAIAQMGFIVFIADGPGTPERGKAFRQAAYMREGQFELAEHHGILMQLAAERPYLDLDRVGVIGHSHGGYLALRAMLTTPEVYHVGIAMEPDVDLFHDNHFYFEPRMGYPKDNPEGYEKASNLPLAPNLHGHLLLIVGTEDYGVFAGTMRMVGELVRFGKQHDAIVMPGQGHDFVGAADDYTLVALVQYLVEHLDP